MRTLVSLYKLEKAHSQTKRYKEKTEVSNVPQGVEDMEWKEE